MEFSEKRASQVAAYILTHKGKEMEIMRLMKLMYLAERENIKRFGYLLTGDKFCSMEWGPVLSKTYDLTKSPANSREGEWYTWMKERDGNTISLRQEGRYSELSQANIQVLDSIIEQFGDYSSAELSVYTHDHCAEWVDPGKSSLPIDYWKVAEAVGYDQDQSEEIDRRIIAQKAVDGRIKAAS